MATKKTKSAVTATARLIDRVRALNQRHSKREIARMLGYHERSIRRILSGEQKPVRLKREPAIRAALTRELSKDSRAASREYRKERIPKLGVAVPPVSRRVTYVGETKPSKTVESKVMRSASSDIFTMLKHYRNRANLRGETAMVRFWGKGSEDSEYPNEYHWSGLQRLNDLSDEEIDEYLELVTTEFIDIEKMRFDV